MAENGTGTLVGEGESADKSIDEMADDGLDLEPHLVGSEGQLSLKLSMKADDVVRSRVKMKKVPTRFPVEGQYQKGDRVIIQVEGIVEDVHFDQLRDRRGTDIGVERIHQVMYRGFTPVED